MKDYTLFIKNLQTPKIARIHLLRNIFALTAILLFSNTFTAYSQQIQITDPTLEDPEEYRISQVRVQGNESTRTQFIINTSGLVEGKVITHPGDDIPDAINRLFRVGLFSDVQVFIENQSLTSLDMLIQVV